MDEYPPTADVPANLPMAEERTPAMHTIKDYPVPKIARNFSAEDTIEVIPATTKKRAVPPPIPDAAKKQRRSDGNQAAA